MSDFTGSVLVTGGAGFIGSELVHQLVGQGARVLVVDNLENGKRENLAGLPEERAQLIVADIRETAFLKELIGEVDIIYHLACLGVRHSIHSPLENQEVNATATLRLVSLARELNVKRFVYVSSSEVYGTAIQVPMTEQHPTFPRTVYGSSKLAGECYVRAFWSTYNYPTTIVRPFNTYGPRCHHEGDSGEVIPKFMLRCMTGQPMVVFGSGKQTRDFTYVSDTAHGILAAGISEDTIGETINLGSGSEIRIGELAHMIARLLGVKEPNVVYATSRPGDVVRLRADVTLAERLIGFKAKASLSEGLEKLKEWYLGLEQSPEELLEKETAQNWEKEGTKPHD